MTTQPAPVSPIVLTAGRHLAFLCSDGHRFAFSVPRQASFDGPVFECQ
jgi:hypothetical protein